ncbi:Membrane protease YdiL, CAAX protease family [Pedobacter steynii]|uniref:Membrane protease YdiL, CAAX protease family n=1 Tax=Pedobacter steynii TaxID=430522 RepID=A0A1G9T711_9SPHI|nr:CPBP family intramembrane glutamic endopeptidase [Pedobacter steynii]NQX37219.1 CPBP family intramembrane metalloprotease [Pedobacter steynii]SDM43438.1 Membrane protease YdiL, CAAX protease family [Pedobacter steynii]
MEEINVHSKKWSHLQGIGLFFLLEIMICATALMVEKQTMEILFYFQALAAITTLFFVGSDWENIRHLLRWKSFSFWKLGACIVLAVLCSLIVQVLVFYLNKTVSPEESNNYTLYQYHPYGNYLMVLSIAVLPAIFEELAYRGYLMQKLLHVVDRKEAIYISSILFFLIHFSLVSFFWLLPFAVLLAYIRIKENTLWYGIVIHFTFNLSSCLVDMLYP